MLQKLFEESPVRPRFLLIGAALASLGARFAFDTDAHFAADARSLAPFITAMGALCGVLAAFICMTIEVIEDLDAPFEGHWANTQQPFVQLRGELAHFHQPEETRSI